MGIRTEMKNLNSFTAVAGAIKAEFARQVRTLENGEVIYRETRRFDEQKGETVLLRRKESVSDYRFLPEPDLLPLSEKRQGNQSRIIGSSFHRKKELCSFA